MLACIQALVILDGRLMAACICSTMLDCACPGPTGKPILWARVQGCEPLLRDHNPTHRASHKYSARILAHSSSPKPFPPQPSPCWRVSLPRGVVVARDLVEVARAPATTHPLSRQAMMHQAMSSQLTEQTRMFTRCHLLTSLKTQHKET